MAKVYIVCPVRKLTEPEKELILKSVADLEKAGHEVRCPFRDTNQVDEIGLRIVGDHEDDIIWADGIRLPKVLCGTLPNTGWLNVLCRKKNYSSLI